MEETNKKQKRINIIRELISIAESFLYSQEGKLENEQRFFKSLVFRKKMMKNFFLCSCIVEESCYIA